jgi:DnaJ like chaperone protein
MDSKLNRLDIILASVGFLLGILMTRNLIASVILSGMFLVITKTLTGKFSFDTVYNNEKLQYVNEILALISIVFTNDKKILKSELNYVKRFLNSNYPEAEARAYLLKFREYTKKNFSIDKICQKIDYELDSSGKRQILHLIIGAAVVDRELTKQELIIIYTIGQKLSIGKITIDSLLSMHSFNYTGQQQGHQQYQRQSGQQQYRRRTSSATSLRQAYSILEITPQATEQEIKKAYRKLAIIYHPDKVMNMGESHQKSAKEKFQKIQAAYEQVKAARGIN